MQNVLNVLFKKEKKRKKRTLKKISNFSLLFRSFVKVMSK